MEKRERERESCRAGGGGVCLLIARALSGEGGLARLGGGLFRGSDGMEARSANNNKKGGRVDVLSGGAC